MAVTALAGVVVGIAVVLLLRARARGSVRRAAALAGVVAGLLVVLLRVMAAQ